jgi:hypothetical protein
MSMAPVLNPISSKIGEMPLWAVTPGSSWSASTWSGVMPSAKSISPLIRACTIGSVVL